MGRWRNILVLGAKHGENAPAKKNVPENATKHGGNEVAMGKHPGFGGNSGRKMHATENTCYKVQRVSYFFCIFA